MTEIEHRKSISSTTDSGQTEDVELVVRFSQLYLQRMYIQNIEDEEENNDEITETTELDEDDEPEEQTSQSDDQKLAAEMANSLADREFISLSHITY